jgi:hypothetical protein
MKIDATNKRLDSFNRLGKHTRQDSGNLRCPIPEGRSQRRGVGKRQWNNLLSGFRILFDEINPAKQLFCGYPI